MVISHDCDIDKFMKPARVLAPAARDAFTITMALVHPVDDLAGGRPNDVRADRMPRYFYLPAEAHHEELCVDLWTTQPVKAAAVANCPRVASLAPPMREALWWKIIRLRLGKSFKVILQGEVPPDEA